MRFNTRTITQLEPTQNRHVRIGFGLNIFVPRFLILRIMGINLGLNYIENSMLKC